ncbi:MAG: AAA family ATPase [Deltaproteobacteria bacterium]|nr:AAA family ATPase [Deltaproteobacteria bacterium]
MLDEQLTVAARGEARLVFVVGEEGAGKTSLARELARTARVRGFRVLVAQCPQAGGAPAYWPWVQLLRECVRSLEDTALRGALGDSAAVLSHLLPSLGGGAAPSAELTRFHLVDEVTQFLKRVAAQVPLVLVLDDLHRADGDSLHLFHWLANECIETPLTLVALLRESGGNVTPPLDLSALISQPQTTTLRLMNFGVDEVRRYVEEAAAFSMPEALARAIHDKTDGNPLFVAEVVRRLASEGRLDTCEGGTLHIAVPATRRQAIIERLGRVSRACRRMLDVAAVIGQDFAGPFAVRMSDLPPVVARRALNEALAEGFLAVSDREDPGLRFVHGLVRQVVYDALNPAARARLHARAAAVLEQRIADEGGSMAVADLPLAAMAHHMVAAATDREGWRRALRWVVAAGDRAAAFMAHEEAARSYAIAVDLAERAGIATTARVHRLLVKLAEARRRTGDLHGARDAGRRAVVVAKILADPTAMATAALAFAGYLPGFGACVSDGEVVSELEQALAVLPSAATALRAQVMARLSEELTYAPGRAAERGLGQQAIDLARGLDDPYALAGVLRTTQWSVWTPDGIARRRELAGEIVALAQRTGDRVLALDGELLRLWSALEHGEAELAWRQLDLCTRLAEALRLPQYAWVAAVARTGLLIATGSLDEAEHLTEHALAAPRRADDATVMFFLTVQRVYVQSLRGSLDDVTCALRSLGKDCPVVRGVLACAGVLTHARAGQVDRARAELEALAADDFASVPRSPGWLMNMATLADACWVVKDVEIARQLYRHLAPFTPYNVVLPPMLVLAPVAHYLGRLAVVLGKDAVARRHFEDALALEHRTGARQYQALTQAAYGRVLTRASGPIDRERGTQLLAAGRAIADELRLASGTAVRDDRASGASHDRMRAMFRRESDGWRLAFQGRVAMVSHRVGMTYLRCLLERPGTPITAVELASLGGAGVLVEPRSGALLDRRAIGEIQHRISEIDAEIDTARLRGMSVPAALLDERAACLEYIHGRRTALIAVADRARSGVTKAIGRALQAIGRAHDALGAHLDRHVETGRSCVYVPNLSAPVVFEL